MFPPFAFECLGHLINHHQSDHHNGDWSNSQRPLSLLWEGQGGGACGRAVAGETLREEKYFGEFLRKDHPDVPVATLLRSQHLPTTRSAPPSSTKDFGENGGWSANGRGPRASPHT